MLQKSDIDGQALDMQPYVLVDTSGTTVYIGTSVSFSEESAPIWRIRKEWVVGTVKYAGYPNGDQGFKFAWASRGGYTYK